MKTVSRRTQFSSSALPPAGTCTASPKAISRRTSYYRVRLEFLSYPHLIPAFCTARGFGPPVCFRKRSSWTWVAHPVSGRVCATSALSDLVSLRLPPVTELSKRHIAHSQAHSSIGIPSTVRLTADWSLAHCRHTVSETISSPSPGCFSPFPRGTCSL